VIKFIFPRGGDAVRPSNLNSARQGPTSCSKAYLYNSYRSVTKIVEIHARKLSTAPSGLHWNTTVPFGNQSTANCFRFTFDQLMKHCPRKLGVLSDKMSSSNVSQDIAFSIPVPIWLARRQNRLKHNPVRKLDAMVETWIPSFAIS
jgi:hypothetical protein